MKKYRKTVKNQVAAQFPLISVTTRVPFDPFWTEEIMWTELDEDTFYQSIDRSEFFYDMSGRDEFGNLLVKNFSTRILRTISRKAQHYADFSENKNRKLPKRFEPLNRINIKE